MSISLKHVFKLKLWRSSTVIRDQESLFILGLLQEFNAQPIIMCLNLHNQSDLSGSSTLTSWLSVSLREVTLPRGRSPALRQFAPVWSHSPPAAITPQLKSVFAMLATRHKEAFVQRIHSEIIQISCTQLGLYVLAVYVWKRENDLHIQLCSV